MSAAGSLLSGAVFAAFGYAWMAAGGGVVSALLLAVALTMGTARAPAGRRPGLTAPAPSTSVRCAQRGADGQDTISASPPARSSASPTTIPAYTGKLDKKQGEERLEKARERLHELQEKLFAQNEWALLVVFQAMDGAGKDSTIEHVMSGRQPRGLPGVLLQGALVGGAGPRLPVAHQPVPPRARAHRRLQPLVLRGGAGGARAPRVPGGREAAARAWSRTASGRSASRTSTPSSATSTRQGIAILKFFLNVSREEQRERFLARLDEPEKNWKFSARGLQRSAGSGTSTWTPTRT